jgi:transcriptional regulator with XRE-family HTH domain
MREGTLDRLKQAMAKKGIARAPALARICGIHPTTARGYVNSKRSPSFDACRKIGPALGVSSEWLFYGTEGEVLAPHPTEGRLAAAQAELRHLREMVAELRQDRDAWRAQAERLATKLKP